MIRQIDNLIRYGRLRTSAPTPRIHKPEFLRHNPGLEIGNLLEFVIAQQARAQEDFFFVQIGAFDGIAGDPLVDLIHRHHWRGILVEPQSAVFAMLQENYRAENQLQFFNVAIGPADGSLTLYTRKSGDVSVASTDQNLLIKPGHPRKDARAIEVPCWTLHTLLERADAPDHLDLLQIDTEGFDYRIIQSIDFQKCRPSLIRYEHTLLSQRDRNACLKLLAAQGYQFLLEDMDTTAIQTQSQKRLVA